MLAQQRRRADGGRRDVLISFLDAGSGPGEPPAAEPEPTDALARSLREQLREAQQRIAALRDDHYLADEDLRAANEELQSINEELNTVNHELKLKLEEVSRAHSDIENLMAATNVPTLFLNADLRIKRSPRSSARSST